MTARLISVDDLRPGTRIRYGNGVRGTITEVRKPRNAPHWRVKIWDDAWGGHDGDVDMGKWVDSVFIRNVTVDNESDPNPTIHERWLGTAHRRR